MKKIKVIVEKTTTGYSAYADRYPVYTTGDTVAELKKNLVEALNFYFKETGERINLSISNLVLVFSISSLFDIYPINAKRFAEIAGINYTLLAQYIQGRKRPSEKQAEKIIEGLQEVGKELSKVQLV